MNVEQASISSVSVTLTNNAVRTGETHIVHYDVRGGDDVITVNIEFGDGQLTILQTRQGDQWFVLV